MVDDVRAAVYRQDQLFGLVEVDACCYRWLFVPWTSEKRNGTGPFDVHLEHWLLYVLGEEGEGEGRLEQLYFDERAVVEGPACNLNSEEMFQWMEEVMRNREAGDEAGWYALVKANGAD